MFVGHPLELFNWRKIKRCPANGWRETSLKFHAPKKLGKSHYGALSEL
jgi:hypothetical protein